MNKPVILLALGSWALAWTNQMPQLLPSMSPYPFIENKGQLADAQGRPLREALFAFSTSGMRGYLTRWGLSFYFYRQAAPNEESRTGVLPEKEERQPSLLAYERVDMELVGATIRPSQVQTTNRSPWGQNYYLAHCSQGILDVRGYGEIVVHAVWPGIDWVLRYEAGGIKQEFIVQAGADLSRVRLRWWGHSIPEVAPSRLSLHTQYGTLTEERLLAYHGIEPRTMAYQILARRQHADGLQVMEIGFTVEGLHQKPQATLLLDPVLQWGTYFGGNEADSPTDITTDPNGNLIVTGKTVVSPDFPLQNPGSGAYYDDTYNGGLRDLFIAKFSGSNLSLLWSTYFGGNGDEPFGSIATDANGNIFLAGWTLANLGFPLLNPGGGAYYDDIFNGGREGFVAKFSGSNLALLWSTYFGGLDDDWIHSVATDPAGNVFITGSSLVLQPFPFQNPGGGAYFNQGHAGSTDAFIAKFNASNLALAWCTAFGGNSSEEAYTVTTDANGHIFIGGITGSSNSSFPLQNPGGGAYFNDVLNDFGHAFIAKFRSSDLALLWSTYFGGNAQDVIRCVDVAPSGDVFIYGYTHSNADFPLQDPGGGAYFDNTFNSTADLFIAKFGGTNLQLVWSTYYGGNGMEELRPGRSLFAGSGFIGAVAEVDISSSSTFPVGVSPACAGAFFKQDIIGSGSDIAILTFTDQGVPLWRTYFGGVGREHSNSITFYNGYAYIAGSSLGSLPNSQLINPGSGAYYDNTQGGIEDCFLLRFDVSSCMFTSSLSPAGNEGIQSTPIQKWRAYWQDDILVIDNVSKPGRFVLMDVTGREIANWEVSTEGRQLSLPLPPGIYTLQDKQTGQFEKLAKGLSGR